MAIVTSSPRKIECHKRVRSDKDPVKDYRVPQNRPAVVTRARSLNL